MYRQKIFDIADHAAALAFAADCGRAHLVTCDSDGRLVSSFIPMLVEQSADGAVSLVGHVARANPLWRSPNLDIDALAIFTGNDAYVSPSFYPSKAEHGRVVPTWNYTVVQMAGRLVIHDDLEWVVALVRRLTDHHEADRHLPWSVDDAPDGFIASTAKAIVGLEVRVGSIEGARKLSQNRSDADRGGVVDGLLGGRPNERAVAEDMIVETAEGAPDSGVT